MTYVRPAVKAIIQNGDKFLILKQNIKGTILWDLPGGRVDHGESPYETLHRECKEEVGLEVDILQSLGMWWFFRMNDNGQIICNTFLCKPKHQNINTSQNPDELENITEFKWVTKEEFLNGDYPVSHESLKELVRKHL